MEAFDLYDPSTLGVAVFAGFVVLSAAVYLVSVYGIQETTYEEAIAKQKIRAQKELQTTKTEPKPKKEKKPFRKSKKEKHAASGDQGGGGARMRVEEPPIQPADIQQLQQQAEVFNPQAVLAEEEPKPEKPQKAEKKQKQEGVKEKKKEKKSERVEKVAVETTQAPAPVKTTQPVKPIMKEEKSAKEEKAVQEPVIVFEKAREVEAPLKRAPAVEEEKVAVVGSPARKGKSGKKEKSVDGDRLVSSLKNASLTDAEIQHLIDILLNRQGGGTSPGEWTKASQKPDPVAAMKKQLQEKEQALQEEMQRAQASSSKVKDLKQEMLMEKTRYAQQETKYRDKIAGQSRDYQALQARMQQTHEMHLSETQAMQNKLKQMQGSIDQGQVENNRTLTEENNRLRAEVAQAAQQREAAVSTEVAKYTHELQKLKDTLANTELQLQKGEELRMEAENKAANIEQQMMHQRDNQKENESLLSKRLGEVSEELRKAEARYTNLEKDMEKLDGGLQDSNTKVKESEDKLKESESAKKELELRIQNIEAQLAEGEKIKTEKDSEIQELQRENADLSSQLKTAGKRVEAEGQEAVSEADGAPNGDIIENSNNKNSISLEEHENLLGEKNKTIEQLQEEINSKKAEMEKLTENLEQQKKKNNDLREKNWKAMDAVSAAEKATNDKVAQAVKSTEEKLKSSSAEEQTLAKDALQRLFPDVSVEASLALKDWVVAFEKEACDVLKKTVSDDSKTEELSSKLSEALEEKEKLSSKCTHYQSVLSDTESILNKLQGSVESEEKKWHEKLQSLEGELGQKNGEIKHLQGQLEESKSNASSIEEVKSQLEASQKELSDIQAEKQKQSEALDNANKQIEELQKDLTTAKESGDSAKITELEKQIETLKADVQKEKGLTKELGTAASKLQTMVKKLQASLTTERENNKKLQEQLSKGGASDSSQVQIEKELAEAAEEGSEKKTEDGTSV